MDSFERFVRDRRPDLKRIAGATKREHTLDDVVNEAWTMAKTIEKDRGITLDLADTAAQTLLLSHLFQHLVRYTERNVRDANRLDHAPGNDAEAGTFRPLMDRLPDDNGRDPLACLIESNEEADRCKLFEQSASQARAWCELLWLRRNDMRSVASYLLISVPHAYRCMHKARLLARMQESIALTHGNWPFLLRPWRRRRVLRTTRQLEFEFDDGLPLPTP